MRATLRVLHVVSWVGTVAVGLIALALIVSQTPWFRDWLRRYIVRESKQYLNGQLTIGGLGGNLLFGADLSNVAIDMSGTRILSVKSLHIDYSVFDVIRNGVVLDALRIDEPYVRIERGPNGWNLANLVKTRPTTGPRKPGPAVSLPSIEIADGRIATAGDVAGDALNVPHEIRDLDVKAAVNYAPSQYTVTLEHVSFSGTSPALTLKQVSGTLAMHDGSLDVRQLELDTDETSLKVNGVVERYAQSPVIRLTTTGHMSLPEIGRVVPAASGYALHPAIDVTATGPPERLALDLDVRSEAGAVKGRLTTDVQAPDFGARGEADLQHLNLAPILKNPAQASDITGHATLDLTMASRPADAPVTDRLDGTFAFEGPRVVAAGYDARNVKVSGSLDGPRLNLDGRAAAYGGTATARGFITLPAPRRPLAFDLQGQADDVDLRGLPVATGAPQMATSLSIASYRIQGHGPAISGTAVLNRSTVEGATVADGTTARFSLTPSTITYGAHGAISSLDLQRIGERLDIATLATPQYESAIDGAFDVSGSLPRTPARAGRRASAGSPSAVSSMTLDATGTLTDSTVIGGSLPRLAFEAHLDHGALRGHANGTFENFNPGKIAGREDLEGHVSGEVNASVAVADIGAPITPDAVTAEGSVTLHDSTVGGVAIDSAAVEGNYASQVADLTRLTVTGPDVKVDASGRMALDRSSQSNLKYHVEAVDLPQLAKLAGQSGVTGTAILDGTLTGNAASLTTTGTMNGSNLGYQENSALDLNSRYTVTVPDLTFAEAKVEATTQATLVKAAGMELNFIDATTTYQQKHVDFTTSIKEKTRELDARGELILHPDHQEVHLPELAVRTEGVEWKMAPGGHAAIQYGGDRIQIENVKLVSGAQSLDLSGSLATGAAAAPDANGLDVTAKNVDLQQLETIALTNRGLTGTLNADATLKGSTAAPVVEGHVRIDNGGFQAYHYDSFTADLDYRGTRVGVDATLQQSPTESIAVKGSLPTSLFGSSKGSAGSADQIDLQITSTALNLAAIQAVVPQITNVTGTLQADVHLTGTAGDPQPNGYIDIKGGGLGVPAIGETYTGLTTRIDLQPEVVKIQQFEIRDRHGERLSVHGQLSVHERQRNGVTIDVNSDNFELLHNELGDVQVQSALQITGELRRPQIVGNVRLDAGRIEVDKVLQLFYDPYATNALPDVVSAERKVEGSGSAEEATKQALASAQQPSTPPKATSAEPETAAPSGPLDPVALDVHVVIPDNLVLRGQDIRPGGPTGAALGNINITVGGDVNVRKQAGEQLALIGTVNTVRGTYEFQGRRFDLERDGTIRFTGSADVNPLLDVTATREIPNTGVVARVHITGTTARPHLALSSDPPLDESDILSLIVFNRPVNELGTGERSSLAATAGGIATGFIAAPLGESIGRALDLDLFEITTSTEDGNLGAGVTLGQQIGDRAFIKLRQEFGERSTTEFMLEYQLAKFLRLDATAAPETTGSANRLNQRRVERAGIDLIFFFSY